MFSGLIVYRGSVVSNEAAPGGGRTLVLDANEARGEDAHAGDSIAVNGVCLTVTRIHRDRVTFDVVPETIERSTLGALRPDELTNVEYSLRVGDRMGGHFVYGHVDATAIVISRRAEGQGERIRIERPEALALMIAEKAFIAVDGVSLTVASVGDGWFEIALIPETLTRTTLGVRPPGSRVNLEVDPLARYAYAAIASSGTLV
jgi:riboflavin synthase